jgi:glucokinase
MLQATILPAMFDFCRSRRLLAPAQPQAPMLIVARRSTFGRERVSLPETDEASMSAVTSQILLGDIGGSNARFAVLAGAELSPIEVLAVKEHPRFADALEAFLGLHSGGGAISQAWLAVAGPVEGNRCSLTNCSWIIDAGALQMEFGWPKVRVINDFEAIAWSLPHLAPSDLYAIGEGTASRGAPMAALGPGTGLGVSCHLPRLEGDIVIASEGGHATLPGTSNREDAVIERLRERFGHVSLERVLSGDGLVNLYQAIQSIDRSPARKRGASEITSAALDGSCVICREALELFCGILGTVAGNAALTFSARGGVYIAGGIAPRIVEFLAGSQFRNRFESKGRYQSYLAEIPTFVIIHQQPAFVGLKWMAMSESESSA